MFSSSGNHTRPGPNDGGQTISNSLAGRKNGIRGALGSAAAGCVSGLFFLGAGQIVGSLMRPTMTAYASGSFRTIGRGLTGVRPVQTGRLRIAGFMRGNTELEGGLQAARDTFTNLVGRAPQGMKDFAVLPNLEVVFRQTSKSGFPKVEVVDWTQKFLEKITFK
jgi:hypothetical protein